MITEREKTFLAHWKKKREIGKWKYSFIHGALLWGIPVYLFLQLFYYLFQDGYTFEIGKFITGLVFWSVIGFLAFGLLMWWLNERAYHKINNKKPG
jgi:hypothetical protein